MKTKTFVMGFVCAFAGTGCLSVETPTETGVSELQPEWCADDAQTAQEDCQAACDLIPDPVDDCLGPANDDLELYFGEVIAAFEAIDPSVAGDVQSCVDSFDGLEDDCQALYQGVRDGMAAYGDAVAEFQAIWSAIPCEGVASLMRSVHWKEASCIFQYKEELLAETLDTGMLYWTLNRAPLELLDWAGRAGSCGVANWVKDAAYWSCVNLGCNGAHALAYAQCRNTCPAPLGSSCVPAGYPAWANCGVWKLQTALDNVGLGSCDCVSDPAPLNPFLNAACASWDGEAYKPWGTFNRSCDADYPERFMNGSTGLWTMTFQTDEQGYGIGTKLGCFSNESLRELELRDSCSFAFDGECEEGDRCDAGTDTTDCTFGG